MQVYDDYALSPENFEVMAKEYKAKESNILSLKTKVSEIDRIDVDSLFNKIEYLRVLVNDLKTRTTNSDVIVVLNQISDDIATETQNLSQTLDGGTIALENETMPIDMFCNNLKIAINTTGDILKLLIKIKDDDETFELSPVLTSSTNTFLEINNQLVSLFGECKYRSFRLFK